MAKEKTRKPISQAHVRHGIKTGLAAATAYMISSLIGDGLGYWGALSTVIVMQMHIASSIQMGWYRFTGTALGSAMGMILIALLPDQYWWTVFGLFLAVSFCAFMTRYSPKYRMAAITVSIVFLASTGMDSRFAFAGFRVLEIAIGVGSAVFFSLALWPHRASDALAGDIREQFRSCAGFFDTLVEAFLDGQKTVPEGMLDPLTEKAWKNHELLAKVLRHESFLDAKAPGNMSRLTAAMDRAVDHLRSMQHALNDIEGHGYEIILTPEIKALAEAVRRGMLALGGEGDADPEAIEAALHRVRTRMEDLREQDVTKRFYTAKVAQFYAFYASLQYLSEDLVLTLRRMCRADREGTERERILSGCVDGESASSAESSAGSEESGASAAPVQTGSDAEDGGSGADGSGRG